MDEALGEAEMGALGAAALDRRARFSGDILGENGEPEVKQSLPDVSDDEELSVAATPIPPDGFVVGEGMHEVMELVERVAHTAAPVLILGETGVGKEMAARAIHDRSLRAGGPIVKINCGAIPPELVDSELFGHERGSFTGAVGTRKGWFERADGGTLFLDEIGELPLAAQVRLLRVLQDGTYERVGGQSPRRTDVRIIAATHRDLTHLVGAGLFRQDLWYRISVFPLWIPPLRKRIGDLPLLARHFAERAAARLGQAPLVPTPEDLALLSTYSWPGNIRELAAVIERAAILGHGKRLELAASLPVHPGPAAVGSAAAFIPSPPERLAEEVWSLDSVVIGHIERALAHTSGRIEGPSGAAALLQVNPHTLRARMRKLRIDWARFRARGGQG
jgi:transcriptional regulator with GAF, ATPase, and Fis domain